MRFKSEREPGKGPAKKASKPARAVRKSPARPEAGAIGVTGTRADGQERRERILRAATELFARQGFEQTTTRQIAEAAKSNIAAIKYYFGDKQGLVAAVLEATRARIAEGGAPPIVTRQEDARDALKTWVVWLLKTSRRRRHADAPTSRLLLNALAMNPDLLGSVAQRLGAPVRANINSLVDQLTDGTLTPPMRETAFGFIFSLCSNFIHGAVLLENMGVVVPDDDEGLDRYAERLTDFIIGGLHTMTDLAAREAGANDVGSRRRGGSRASRGDATP